MKLMFFLVFLCIILVTPLPLSQKRFCRPLHAGLKYQSFDAKVGVEDTLVVDCLHRSCPTLTHHKGSRTPPELKDDTSGCVTSDQPYHYLVVGLITCCTHQKPRIEYTM